MTINKLLELLKNERQDVPLLVKHGGQRYAVEPFKHDALCLHIYPYMVNDIITYFKFRDTDKEIVFIPKFAVNCTNQTPIPIVKISSDSTHVYLCTEVDCDNP